MPLNHKAAVDWRTTVTAGPAHANLRQALLQLLSSCPGLLQLLVQRGGLGLSHRLLALFRAGGLGQGALQTLHGLGGSLRRAGRKGRRMGRADGGAGQALRTLPASEA